MELLGFSFISLSIELSDLEVDFLEIHSLEDQQDLKLKKLNVLAVLQFSWSLFQFCDA